MKNTVRHFEGKTDAGKAALGRASLADANYCYHHYADQIAGNYVNEQEYFRLLDAARVEMEAAFEAANALIASRDIVRIVEVPA